MIVFSNRSFESNLTIQIKVKRVQNVLMISFQVVMDLKVLVEVMMNTSLTTTITTVLSNCHRFRPEGNELIATPEESFF